MAKCSMSSIDLTLCCKSIAQHLDRTVLSDLYGTDHYPVLIHVSTPRPALEYPPHWILARGDWTVIIQSINRPTETIDDVNNMSDCFTSAVLSAAVIYTCIKWESQLYSSPMVECEVCDCRPNTGTDAESAAPSPYLGTPH